MPARVAADAGEAVVRVAALEEALEHLLFHRAPDASRAPQLLGVPRGALPQGARSGIARPVEAVGCGPGERSVDGVVMPIHAGANAPAGERSTSSEAALDGDRLRQQGDGDGRWALAAGSSGE